MAPISLNTSISDLYMVGKTYASRLKKLNIQTVEDLFHHYPFRYNNCSLVSKISQLQIGETATIQGKIVYCKNVYTKSHKKIQKAIIADESGQIEVVWFNQPFLTQTLKPLTPISLSGKVGFFGHSKTITSPEYEILKEKSGDLKTIHTGRLVPIYPETYGVSSKWLRSRIAPLLTKTSFIIKDWLPETIKKQHSFISLTRALKQIHFPENNEEAQAARKRLGFDELLLVQLAALQRKKKWQENKATHPFKINLKKITHFIKKLPFNLTKAQTKVLKEIVKDLKKEKPMNRLLEGDVGSGKTVIAAISMYISFLNGLQSVLMAPTEILAQQHYITIQKLLCPFKIKVSLLTGSKKPKSENANILIGTHALIYTQSKLKKLGLVVIDEQHRFGVEQRAKLISRGKAPHLLTMTATPIPRTIALTLYGDLDLSILDEIPQGRKKTKTWVVPQSKRAKAYQWIEKQIRLKNSLVFIVCPLIEESTKESMKDIKAAKDEFEKLAKKIFPKLTLGLLHGKMKTKEKDEIIEKFRKEKINILVSTPVVEVGIDIPQATIMMIEAADRFGLAQLHQLRGRVGRSKKQSYCLLFTEKENTTRLKAMQQKNSGFELAEIDLKIRGAGEIYGTRQHGFVNFKIANLSDIKMVEQVKKTAADLINKTEQFPLLKEKLKNYTIRTIEPN